MAKSKTKAPQASILDGETETPLNIEEVPQPAPQAVAIIPVDEKVKQEIARFDVARTWIADRKKKYKSLKITGPDDKDGQKKVHAAWQEIRNKRLAVDKKHKEIKADYLTITRGIDGEKNELTSLLSEIETPLKNELDRIEKEKEEIKLKAEREAEEKLQGRVSELLEGGIKFNGSYYAIGESISIDVVTLRSMPDEKYNELLTRVQKEAEDIKAAEAEEQRKKEEEAEKLRLEKEEQEKERQRLEDERKELQRQRDEMEQQKKELSESVKKSRINQLESLGMVFSITTEKMYYKNDNDRVEVETAGLSEKSVEDWQTLFKNIKKSVDDLKAEQKKLEAERAKKQKEEEDLKKEQELRLSHRGALLISKFGMQNKWGGEFIRADKHGLISALVVEVQKIVSYTNEEWDEYLKEVEAVFNALVSHEKWHDDKQAKEREAARVLMLGDAEKIREFLDKVTEALDAEPEVKDENIKTVFLETTFALRAYVDTLKTFINDKIKGDAKGN